MGAAPDLALEAEIELGLEAEGSTVPNLEALRERCDQALLERGQLELGASYRPPPGPPGADAEVAQRRTPGGGRPSGGEAAERIARATMATVARRGYGATRIADIAAAAHVLLSTFYEEFAGKEAAFAAALEGRLGALEEAAGPALREKRNWPDDVRRAVAAAFGFLASEPDFARVISADVYAAGPAGLEQRDAAIEAARRLLMEGFDRGRAASPISGEAVVSIVYSMLCERVQGQGAATLPEMAPLASYVILAPFLGAEEAWAAASG